MNRIARRTSKRYSTQPIIVDKIRPISHTLVVKKIYIKKKNKIKKSEIIVKHIKENLITLNYTRYICQKGILS